jgi:hypothetical protein
MICFILALGFTGLTNSAEIYRLHLWRSPFFHIRSRNYCPYYSQSKFYSAGTNFPKSVSGTARYNPFEEYLPKNRGVYKILNRNGIVKYIGSSEDIHKRVITHRQSGILVKGDRVAAVIFHHHTKQKIILDYEKKEIRRLNPIKNISAGATGRGWDSERVFKLRYFYLSSKNKLLAKYRRVLKNFLCGKDMPSPDRKTVKHFLRIMQYFK